MPDKPFFMYFAPGATHAPHHVPKEWIDKYKGKFDQGWDKLREETFARQKELGVIPADAELTKRPAEIPAWDDDAGGAEADPRPRRWRSTPAFLEHTDHHIGRLIDTLKDLEILDDTLIYYIIGDNGASAEGTLNGCFNEMAMLNGMGRHRDARVPDEQDRRLRRTRGLQPLRGGLGARDGHAVPVDQAGRLALGRHAQRHDRALAERHQGEGRDPLAVPPRDRHRADDPRSRGAARIRRSSTACSRRRIEGVSMLYAFNDAKAAERHETQYFEMFCNRGIYHKGWTAVTRHGMPWDSAPTSAPSTTTSGSCTTPTRTGPRRSDLAKENPEKLRRAAAALPDRGDQVQRAPARRSHVRALQPGPRRPAAADQGQLADPVRRHGPADRELVVVDARTSRTR